MARNPRWCLERAGVARACSTTGSANRPEALLNASIFFDFRALAGEARLAGRVARSRARARRAPNRAFCRAMAQAVLEARPPLGLLADFAADELDLKAPARARSSMRPACSRSARGSRETGTAARLRAAGEATAAEAFHYLQTLRLRRKATACACEALNDIERRVLKEAFRQDGVLQRAPPPRLRVMSWFRRTPLEPARWVVIDCETSGLDAARDRLLSVGAVCVRDGRVDLRLSMTFGKPRRARRRTS